MATTDRRRVTHHSPYSLFVLDLFSLFVFFLYFRSFANAIFLPVLSKVYGFVSYRRKAFDALCSSVCCHGDLANFNVPSSLQHKDYNMEASLPHTERMRESVSMHYHADIVSMIY